MLVNYEKYLGTTRNVCKLYEIYGNIRNVGRTSANY
ncbi:hypothetical protein Vi05172_g6394 [Venturia inaequalis]|nr:hypothetical protein Vi05172_g6394 [Venturia inaequalis]